MASPAPQHFPDRPQFSDFMKPCRFEGEVQNLEVHGDIPNDIDGTFYRVMPDPQLPPFIDNDPWFNGDGNVSAFRIKNGSVTFQQKYVRTEKFVREREARRALIGKYRNKFTDAVEFTVRSTANTNVVSFNNQLLALKEDSPPYAMDPETLETQGLYTFDGQLPSVTFTAHPKTDPVTGELICFGYEAKGDGSPDICYYTIGPDVTENWVLFPVIPQLCDLERLKQGGEHWQWSPETPFYIGVIPRYGAKSSDVKSQWFTYKNSFPGHTANAYEQDDGKIVFDLGLSDKNVFYWWPDAQGNSPEPSKIHSQLTRFTVNPHAEEGKLPEPKVLHHGNSEFYRIDDRFSGRKYSHSFFDLMDPSLGTDFAAIGPVMGGGYPPYNSLAHHVESTGKTEVYFPGRTHLVQEPVFIPRAGSKEEGDGYLMALVNNYRTLSSELHLLDCRDFTKARATILLPLRLRAGLHGNWVDNN
ncbi:Carotenoid oxygenase [Penicillium expansum]|uniref:Carotenoid oxygenase n=1 Tax=Penicillium expansum TaxID=27334 RepID=A0A0A2K3W4_PENEN|nr:Carotenoid oxygenase [Penicillium expansum]KGO42860.1 Carotenoid oxygenase [Penicillium expansum]KGO56981.1 Carotenoid oxygenase [Penicillium expansum]KGO61608.1 Carotenoid oxygenase [Penicillium expansum]